MSITIFSKNNCSQCAHTKRFFSFKGLHYTEKNISESSEHLNEALATGYRSMPIVLIEGQEPISGYDLAKLEAIFGEL